MTLLLQTQPMDASGEGRLGLRPAGLPTKGGDYAARAGEGAAVAQGPSFQRRGRSRSVERGGSAEGGAIQAPVRTGRVPERRSSSVISRERAPGPHGHGLGGVPAVRAESADVAVTQRMALGPTGPADGVGVTRAAAQGSKGTAPRRRGEGGVSAKGVVYHHRKLRSLGSIFDFEGKRSGGGGREGAGGGSLWSKLAGGGGGGGAEGPRGRERGGKGAPAQDGCASLISPNASSRGNACSIAKGQGKQKGVGGSDRLGYAQGAPVHRRAASTGRFASASLPRLDTSAEEDGLPPLLSPPLFEDKDRERPSAMASKVGRRRNSCDGPVAAMDTQALDLPLVFDLAELSGEEGWETESMRSMQSLQPRLPRGRLVVRGYNLEQGVVAAGTFQVPSIQTSSLERESSISALSASSSSSASTTGHNLAAPEAFLEVGPTGVLDPLGIGRTMSQEGSTDLSSPDVLLPGSFPGSKGWSLPAREFVGPGLNSTFSPPPPLAPSQAGPRHSTSSCQASPLPPLPPEVGKPTFGRSRSSRATSTAASTTGHDSTSPSLAPGPSCSATTNARRGQPRGVPSSRRSHSVDMTEDTCAVLSFAGDYPTPLAPTPQELRSPAHGIPVALPLIHDGPQRLWATPGASEHTTALRGPGMQGLPPAAPGMLPPSGHFSTADHSAGSSQGTNALASAFGPDAVPVQLIEAGDDAPGSPAAIVCRPIAEWEEPSGMQLPTQGSHGVAGPASACGSSLPLASPGASETPLPCDGRRLTAAPSPRGWAGAPLTLPAGFISSPPSAGAPHPLLLSGAPPVISLPGLAGWAGPQHSGPQAGLYIPGSSADRQPTSANPQAQGADPRGGMLARQSSGVPELHSMRGLQLASECSFNKSASFHEHGTPQVYQAPAGKGHAERPSQAQRRYRAIEQLEADLKKSTKRTGPEGYARGAQQSNSPGSTQRQRPSHRRASSYGAAQEGFSDGYATDIPRRIKSPPASALKSPGGPAPALSSSLKGSLKSSHTLTGASSSYPRGKSPKRVQFESVVVVRSIVPK